MGANPNAEKSTWAPTCEALPPTVPLDRGGFKYESRQVLSRIVLREEYESRGIFGADD